MKKAFQRLYCISSALIAIAAAIFLIYTYWDRITSGLTTFAKVASNVLSTLTGDNMDNDENPSDYYDI